MKLIDKYINTSIVENFFRSADKFPDKPAIIVSGESVTYSQLKALVLGAAEFLSQHNIKSADRVILKAIPSVPYVSTLLAVHMCSAITVPVEKSMQHDGIMGIKDFVGSSLAVVDYECQESDFFTLAQIYDAAKSNTANSESPNKGFVFPDADAPGEIMFTTGTTGSSKGIVLSYRNVLAAAQNTLEFTGMQESDVNVIPAPLNHSFGIRRMYACLAIGSTAVLLNGVTSVRLFFKALDQYNATSIISVPAAMKYIFRMTGDKLGEYKDKLRFVELGADFVPNDLKEKLLEILPKTNLFNIYGSSEAGCVVGINYRENPGKLSSIGKDAVNANIQFTNENGEFIDAVSEETSGLLTISGSMVMQGYLNDPDLTASTVRDGYLYTSDIGYRDSDGFIFLIGRKGDVISIGGNKVSPAEVEQIANLHPSVAESACIGCPDPNGVLNKVLKLFIVPQDGAGFSPSELKTFITSKLEAYKVPLIYEVIDSLPKTSNGKLQRNKLS